MYFQAWQKSPLGKAPRARDPKIMTFQWIVKEEPSSYHDGGDWPPFHVCNLCCTIYLGTHRQIPVYSKVLILV